jgi:hypothetical protein
MELHAVEREVFKVLGEQDRADMELIVRAVNRDAAFDALLKAAKDGLTTLRYLRDKDTAAWDLAVTPEICNAWDDLRAAITSAEAATKGGEPISILAEFLLPG